MLKQVALTSTFILVTTFVAVHPFQSPQARPEPIRVTPAKTSTLMPLRLSAVVSPSLASTVGVPTTPHSVNPISLAPAERSVDTTYASALPQKFVANRVVTADGKSYENHVYHATSLPNDPAANQPWVTGAKLPSAWDVPRGSTPTVLAIIDTGVALKHQEFRNRWYTNNGESGATSRQNPSILNCTDRRIALNQSCNLIDDDGDGIVDNESGATTAQNPSLLNCTDQHVTPDKSCNLVDDDNNGYIDDVHGWDFANNDRSVQAGQVFPNGSGTHHATYVTGVAAATGNDGLGIAGVDWGTTILPIQALDDNGSGSTVSVANAIDYATSQHANVISLSLGSNGDDPLVHQAVDRAIAAGISVVAAAGNDGCDCMLYPANYPEVISVGAANNDGSRASFSSYGPNLTVMAPGVNLYTSDWQPGNSTSAYASGISGTSLATPIISGLLTRLLSQQPASSPAQLRAALLENTNRGFVGANQPRTDTYGFGNVDAGRSSTRMATSFSPPQRYAFSGVNGGVGTYQCEEGTVGATAIRDLSTGGSEFFTTSAIENQAAVDQGFSSSIFAYGCVAEPQDTPVLVRGINLLSEFRNIQTKY